jgi:hypothetical protein
MPLPAGIAAGWVVTIYDKERTDEPHITVRFKFKFWRVDLRRGTVLDPTPPERELDAALLDHIRSNLEALGREWDRIHPHMPMMTVESEDDPQRRSRTRRKTSSKKRKSTAAKKKKKSR